MLLSLQIGQFSFVRAFVACASLERISGFKPSSETTAPRYLKLVTVSSFCPSTFPLDAIALFVISNYLNRISCAVSTGASNFQLRALIVIGKPQTSYTWPFHHVLQEHQTWSFQEDCWRGWVTEDIPASHRLLFWTILPCCTWAAGY